MKPILATLCLLLVSTLSFAQETIEVIQKITKNVNAVYHVLKDRPDVKQGLYQVRVDKTKALASGMYADNKKVGMWHYFDKNGQVAQNYDYDKNLLTYEAPNAGGINYIIDKDFKNNDLITRPIRLGGNYYGYLPYILLFKKPADITTYAEYDQPVTLELLITPFGNLADYTIHLGSEGYPYDLNVNLDLLDKEDKKFIPATLNGQPVAARIVIHAIMDHSGKIIL